MRGGRTLSLDVRLPKAASSEALVDHYQSFFCHGGAVFGLRAGAGRHCQFVPDCARGDSRCRMEVFMFIEITEKPASHRWGVCIDALEVNFNSLAQAQAFVDQLKARIEAPHVWPNARDSAARASRIPQARTDLV
jgi:hypothetical protein